MDREAWRAVVHGVAKSQTQPSDSTELMSFKGLPRWLQWSRTPTNAGDGRDMGSILGQEDPLEKEMATHSSILAWRIPCTEEPSGLWLKGTQRVGHD